MDIPIKVRRPELMVSVWWYFRLVIVRLLAAVAGDLVTVTLELDDGYRNVDVPAVLVEALVANGVERIFHDITYSKRKEYARQVNDAKADETKERRIKNIIEILSAR